jgi:hypothetical protein
MERSLRTSQLRTPGGPEPARWRRARPRRSVITGVVAACGLLMLGVSAPAEAAVKSAPAPKPVAKTTGAAAAATTTTFLTGEANNYEFYTFCKGTSPASFRVVAACANFQGVIGAEATVGTGNLSYANCAATGNLGSTLATGTSAQYGIVLCSNANGTGTFQGYQDRGAITISSILLAWGGGATGGGIPAGGNLMCQYSTSVPAVINLGGPP